MSSEMPHLNVDLKPSRNIDAINKRLMDLRKSGVHLIGPGVQSLAKLETIPASYEINWHCFMFDTNFGTPQKEYKDAGPDFYHDKRWDSADVAFKREALLKMWMASGARELGTNREDDGLDPYLVRWRFMAAVQDFSGNWVPAQATKEIDLRNGSASAESMKSATSMLSQQRRDIVQLAESKAQNRVIRKLLGIRQKYTADEILKPFVLMRLVLVPDMNDPATKLFVLANAYGATAALFGNPDFTRMILNAAPVETVDTGKQLPAAPATTTQAALPAAPATVTEKHQLTPREEKILDFKAADSSEQIRILKDMMSKKGVGSEKLNRPLERFIDAERVDLFGQLLELADQQPHQPAFKL